MKTQEQVALEFKSELQALVDKYGAEIEARDHWQGYAECGEDVRMEATIDGIYDADGNCLQEFSVIDLGSIIFPRDKP